MGRVEFLHLQAVAEIERARIESEMETLKVAVAAAKVQNEVGVFMADFINGVDQEFELNLGDPLRLKIMIDDLSKVSVNSWVTYSTLWLTRRNDDDTSLAMDPRYCTAVQGISLTSNHLTQDFIIQLNPIVIPGRYTLSLRAGRFMTGSTALPSQEGKKLIEFIVGRVEFLHLQAVAETERIRLEAEAERLRIVAEIEKARLEAGVVLADFIEGKFNPEKELNVGDTFKLRVILDDISKTNVGSILNPSTLWLTRRNDDDKNITIDPRDCTIIEGIKLTAEHASQVGLIQLQPIIAPGRYTLSLRAGKFMTGSTALPSQKGKKLIEFIVGRAEFEGVLAAAEAERTRLDSEAEKNRTTSVAARVLLEESALIANFVDGPFKLERDLNIGEPLNVRVVIDEFSKSYIGAVVLPLTLWLTRRNFDDIGETMDPCDCKTLKGIALTSDHVMQGGIIQFAPIVTRGCYTLSLRGGILMTQSKALPSQEGRKLIEFVVGREEFEQLRAFAKAGVLIAEDVMKWKSTCEKNKFEYFMNGEKQQLFYDKPNNTTTGIVQDMTRYISVAKKVSSLAGQAAASYYGAPVAVEAGYSLVKYGKIALGAYDLVNTVISKDNLEILKVITHELSALDGNNKMNLTVQGLQAAYYISCQHKIEQKDASRRRVLDFEMEECPPKLLDRAAKYLACAQWLYSSNLPAPYDSEEYFAWRLVQLTKDRTSNWTIIGINSKTILLKDGTLCPAFCLAARSEPVKEFCISIRGSVSTEDWNINANDKPFPFTFDGETGFVHRGMYLGVLGILDIFDIMKYVEYFVGHGYSIRVAGHSLGAGTAMLMSAEIINRHLASGKREEDIDILAVGIATPPVTSENIAVKIAARDWLSVINQNDIVPRLSRNNLNALNYEINEFSKTGKPQVWSSADIKDVKAYMLSCGKQGDIDYRHATLGSETAMGAASSAAAPVVIESINTKKDEEKLDIILVPPGKLIYIHKPVLGMGYEVSLINHRHPTLRKVNLVLDEMVKQHEMCEYWIAMRGAKTQMVLKSMSRSNSNASSKNYLIGEFLGDSCDEHFRTCGICNLDVTWPFISHSDASVSTCSQNCSVCGIVVCVICAPAGDVIPGNGFEETITLTDWRICVAEKGMTTPQRVCVHCYLKSYGLY